MRLGGGRRPCVSSVCYSLYCAGCRGPVSTACHEAEDEASSDTGRNVPDVTGRFVCGMRGPGCKRMQAQADAYAAHASGVRELPWLRKATGVEIRDGFGILGWVPARADADSGGGQRSPEKAAAPVRVAIGNKPFMQELGVDIAEAERTKWLRRQEDCGRTGLYVALGDRLAALITIQDPIKPEARGTVTRLMQAKARPCGHTDMYPCTMRVSAATLPGRGLQRGGGAAMNAAPPPASTSQRGCLRVGPGPAQRVWYCAARRSVLCCSATCSAPQRTPCTWGMLACYGHPHCGSARRCVPLAQAAASTPAPPPAVCAH